MKITPDPKANNSWLMDAGEKQYDYEGWLGLSERGVIGPMDDPATPSQDVYNQDLSNKALIDSPAFKWLAEQGIVPVYTTNKLLTDYKTARITIDSNDDAQRFSDYLEQNP